MVFISSVAGDLDDLKFIQQEDKPNTKPRSIGIYLASLLLVRLQLIFHVREIHS